MAPEMQDFQYFKALLACVTCALQDQDISLVERLLSAMDEIVAVNPGRNISQLFGTDSCTEALLAVLVMLFPYKAETSSVLRLTTGSVSKFDSPCCIDSHCGFPPPPPDSSRLHVVLTTPRLLALGQREEFVPGIVISNLHSIKCMVGLTMLPIQENFAVWFFCSPFVCLVRLCCPFVAVLDFVLALSSSSHSLGLSACEKGVVILPFSLHLCGFLTVFSAFVFSCVCVFLNV